MDKAHPLECRSRTPRNTDGLVSLSALPLSDLRAEIKQERLPASAPAEGNVRWPLFSYYVWRRDYTLDAAHVYLLSTALCLRGARRPDPYFLDAWLIVCIPANVYTRVCKQDAGESIHLGGRAHCAVAAEQHSKLFVQTLCRESISNLRIVAWSRAKFLIELAARLSRLVVGSPAVPR